ncbi:LOW QUALITY PROTEIN: hypothetical protein MAR_015950 [Mya arenaria]|uniref:SWIM-type domain-containing protein n=1 Tax=Mya arenaria TaxID=6604 RepID=A0ABY7FM24_MYAAR|nr:LOW QUALITY PROTEIN: hypothetical protein MAR_015950 [Mya arenaria]
MFSETLVHITYTGSIKHDINEYHDRPLAGVNRNKVKSILKDRKMPLKYFMEQFDKTPSDKIIAGNFGVIGKTSKKLQQIGVESRHNGRRRFIGKFYFTGKNMRKQDGGFIQKIVVFPFYYIIYFNESGLRLYNDRAKDSILYWDATGGLIRKTENNKRFLYYELAIASPVKGRMGIPITSMISERQSLPVVLDWLREFRYGEKALFGYSRLIQYPRMIVSDQSMVFILAALTEFNSESIKTYLQRAFNIISGKATISDVNKTIIYYCKRLLMKCGGLKELQELMFDSFIVLTSKFITERNKPFFDRLQNKLYMFEVKVSNETNFKVEQINKESKDVNANKFTKEEYQIMGTCSPFKNLIQRYQKITMKYIVQDGRESDLNKCNCEFFMDYLCKNALPIFPFWSTILLGDLGRFNKEYTSDKKPH